MRNVFKIIYELIKDEEGGWWSKVKFSLIIIIVILLLTLFSVLMFFYMFFLLFPYLILRGRGKVQDLQLFFMNKGWVNLVDVVKYLSLGKKETKFLLSFLFSGSKSEIKYIINNKFAEAIKLENLEIASLVKLIASHKVPTPFNGGKTFTLNFYEGDCEVKSFELNGESYCEYTLDVTNMFSTKRIFYRNFIDHIVSNSGSDFSLEKLGFSIEIFVPTKIKGKKIKSEKSKFSFGSVFGYR